MSDVDKLMLWTPWIPYMTPGVIRIDIARKWRLSGTTEALWWGLYLYFTANTLNTKNSITRTGRKEPSYIDAAWAPFFNTYSPLPHPTHPILSVPATQRGNQFQYANPDSKVYGTNMGPTTQAGPMLAPWTLLSGNILNWGISMCKKAISHQWNFTNDIIGWVLDCGIW